MVYKCHYYSQIIISISQIKKISILMTVNIFCAVFFTVIYAFNFVKNCLLMIKLILDNNNSNKDYSKIFFVLKSFLLSFRHLFLLLISLKISLFTHPQEPEHQPRFTTTRRRRPWQHQMLLKLLLFQVLYVKLCKQYCKNVIIILK